MAQSAVETMGIISFLMMRSDVYRDLTLGELRHLCQPPMDAGLAVTAKSPDAAAGSDTPGGQPMAFALFAKVSDTWHAKLSDPTFKPENMPAAAWTSGDNYWLVSLLGLTEIAPRFAMQAAQSLFATGDTLHIRMMDTDGSVSVSQRTL